MKRLAAMALMLAIVGCKSSAPAGSSQAFVTTADKSSDALGTCDNPIRVGAFNADGGARAEVAYLNARHAGYTGLKLRASSCKGQPADRATFRSADGKKVTLYFDSSKWRSR